MTICIAIRCDCSQDGKEITPRVIMAADRMITSNYLEIEFEHPLPKLTALTKNCVVATAGDALAPSDLFELARQKITQSKHTHQISEIVTILKESYVELRDKKIEDFILKPAGISSIETFYKSQQFMHPEIVLKTFEEIKKFDFGVQLLIGGVDNSGSHIYAIDNPGFSFNLDSLGYDAIGSGENHAILTFIGANYHSKTSFEEALYLTYKAKRISEKAPGIGTNFTDLWVIEPDVVYEVTDSEDGLGKLKKLYKTEMSQTKMDFKQLTEIAKTNIRDKKDVEFEKSYS